MKLQRCIRLRIIASAAVVVFFFPLGAATQDVGSKDSALRVFTTRSIATVLEKIGTDFERRTGRRLSVTTDVAVRMVRRINGVIAMLISPSAPFGQGAIEGVAGPESANNAAAQTSFVPLLTLGLPSNPSHAERVLRRRA